jgi:AraC-like DNA-binding protein
MVLAVLRSSGLRALLRDAVCTMEPALARLHVLDALPADPVHSRACNALIHDFRPDPVRSMEWLDGLGRSHVHVFALLERPAGPVLDAIVRMRHRFMLDGIALADEETPETLNGQLQAWLARSVGGALCDVVLDAWPLDGILRDLVERELSAPRPHATIAGLLRGTGIGRKQFAAHARACGFRPPLRLLHGLRVLRAAALLQQGSTTTEAALDLGYGSADTMRVHFREIVGLPPGRASAFSLHELAERGRTRLLTSRMPSA